MSIEIIPLELPEVRLVRPRRFGDDRGWFCETFNEPALRDGGIYFAPMQDNQSCSALAGTLRGLHLQTAPYAQAKLVRVLRGAILDVVVDVRPASPTFGRAVRQHLDADSGEQLFVPKGFAHGFLTLEDRTEVFYKVDDRYAPGHAVSIAWNDPDLDIDWPVDDPILSAADRDAFSFAEWCRRASRAA